MATTASPPPIPQDSRGAKSTAARNPISSRLYKVLGTNYNDPALREALEIVSELHSTPELSGKHAEYKDQEKRPLDTGKVGLPSSGIAARARKSLRRDAELRLTQASRQFLKAFQEVDKHLDVLQTHIDEMVVRCDEGQKQLQSTNEACSSLLDKAGGLRYSRRIVQEQQAAVESFLAHFSLTDEEAELLTSRDIIINKMFFRAMGKAEYVMTESQILMSSEDGSSKAGIEIASTATQQLEHGYDKLARWCSLQFRHFVRDALLEVTPLLSEGVKWLSKRPELLSETLAALAQTRQATLLNAFMDALMRGGPGGLPRPIEIHAHDPMRYVGDMLAWVHQAIAGEREFLEGLFRLKGERRMVGSVRQFGDSDEENWIRELMDKAFDKLKSPLKVRIRQTVRSQESCIISYKVANLVSFYNVTMGRTIGEKAALSVTLNEITDEAYVAFYDTVEAQCRSLARTILPDDQDMQPPVTLLDHTQILRELLNVYKSSLIGDESAEELQKGFQHVLDLMVDAAVNMCLTVADARQSQKAGWDGDIFVLNCLSHLLNVINSFSFAQYKVEEIQADVRSRSELLIADHSSNILQDTSLAACIEVCNSNPSGPISRIDAMQPQPLSEILRAFSAWLSTPDVVQPARLSHLLDRRLAEHVHHAALRTLVAEYERICTEVRKPENKYEAANTILGAQRPFGSLQALRQILGVDEA